MGIYTNKIYNEGYGIEVDADESYNDSLALERAFVESVQNDAIFFNSIIQTDIQESYMINEGVSDYEIEVFQEAAVGGLFGKLIEFVKKIWEKIKGIFKTLWVKLENLFSKDGKSLVAKYKKEVLRKNLSKMKYKWAERKTAELNLEDVGNEGFNTVKTMREEFVILDGEMSIDKNEDVVKKLEDDLEDDTLLEKQLGDILGGGSSIELADFDKEAHEYLFDDVEDEDSGAQSKISDVIRIIENGPKELSNLKKYENALNKFYKATLKKIEDKSKEVIKDIPKGKDNEHSFSYMANPEDKKDPRTEKTTTGSTVLMNRALNVVRSQINIMQQAQIKGINAKVACIKYEVKQSRAFFMKAVSFNPNNIKESAILEQTMAQVGWDSVDECFN